ncbi:MAG: septum formation initiator family protein [Patescibacteria group bacterium]
MKNKSKFQVFFYSKQFIFVCVVLICFLVFGLWQEYNRQAKVNLKITELKSEIGNLENSNFELAHLLSYLKTDENIELEARKTLGYKKPGEKVVVITNGLNQQVLGINNIKESSNPQKWFRYFFESAQNIF